MLYLYKNCFSQCFLRAVSYYFVSKLLFGLMSLRILLIWAWRSCGQRAEESETTEADSVPTWEGHGAGCTSALRKWVRRNQGLQSWVKMRMRMLSVQNYGTKSHPPLMTESFRNLICCNKVCSLVCGFLSPWKSHHLPGTVLTFYSLSFQLILIC